MKLKYFAPALPLVLGALSGFLGVSAPARQNAGQQLTGATIVVNEIKHDVSPPLRSMRLAKTAIGESEPEESETVGGVTPATHPLSFVADPVLQSFAALKPATTPGLSFDGVGASGWSAPDTDGAVGATQFVEWVNAKFAVYDKTTGALKLGPRYGNTLWSGFGGPCQTNNNGDIIAQYDKAAARWVMTQHVDAPNGGPYFQCVAVSTSSDATGSFFRYAFSLPAFFPDYPKLGVWPDAYYLALNLANPNSFAFVAPYVCALNRSAMLTGASATAQCFQLASNYQNLLPSDWDGATAPPAGSPDYFMSLGTNSLNIWQFHVDWNTTSNTTFTGPTNIPVAPFNQACNGGVCIPQSGTSQQLDSLGDRLMYRLAYRNFGDHEALVVNHSIVAGSSVGVRWYEIRSPGSNPSVYQSGTFAPDSNYRWMGSIAMDKAGDMALGYSLSSSSMNPAIAYTGRVPSDALGALESESTIIQGGGAQQSNDHRWGDYTSMAIDPSDDCTFWYANEYLKTNGTMNWSTRIASLSFPSCSQGGASFALSASPSSQTVAPGSSTSYTVTVTPANGFNAAVNFSVAGLPTGASASFSPTTVTGSGSTTMTLTTGSSTPTGSSTLTITGTSGSLSQTVSVTLVVSAGPSFSLSGSPLSQTVVQGSSTTYSVTVTPSNGFNGTVSFSVAGLPSNASASFSPATVTGSGSTTMTVTTASSTPTGGFTLTITGSSGSLSATASVTLVVNGPPNFSLSGSPSSQTVAPASSTSYTVTVTPSYGFNGTVNFSVAGLPTGGSASFSPTTVTGSGSTTMTVSTTSATPVGTSTLTVTGTSGSLTQTTSVTLVVSVTPGYSLSPSPSTQTVAPGSSAIYTINVTAFGGFSGSVDLSVTGMPLGCVANFVPSTVTGSGSSTLTIATTSGTTPLGTYSLTISGKSGSTTQTTSITMIVSNNPDFSLSASPLSQTVVQGSSTNYTITVSPLNGFAGTVSFSVAGLPSNASASFNPSTITTSGSTTMTVTTTSSTTTGSFPLTVTGTSGGTAHAANGVTLVVNPPASTSTALSSSLNPSVFGQSVTFTATVTSGGGTPTGTVTFQDGGTTIGTGTLNASAVATFTTSTLTVGSHSITGVYSGDANFAPSTSPALSQSVVAAVVTANLSSTNVSFGNQPVSSPSPTQTVTLTNTGNSALAITGISLTDSTDFAQSNTCGSSVNAGSSCTISLTFTPSALGPFNGQLSISDNAGNSPQTINLSGTGTNNPVPQISQPVSPASVVPGASTVTLTVNGAGFVPSSVVKWNGSARSTTFVSGTKLTASVLAGDVAAASTGWVTVSSPGPGGGVSGVAFLQITNSTSSVSLGRSDLNVGTLPSFVAEGDFNGDGIPDLAVVNTNDNDVAVLLGNGDGTFQNPVTYQTGSSPVAVLVGDFNGDGKLDLAVVNSGSNSVSILLGNGNGTFQPHQDSNTGNHPAWAAAGDFNSDGKLDLAVANTADNTVSILLGNGDGTFQPHQDSSTGSSPVSVTTADFNGDGFLDLAVANSAASTVSVLLGNGDGTFQAHQDSPTGSGPVAVIAADFNGDGKVDLVTANASQGMISFLAGKGNGTFQNHVDFAAGNNPRSVVSGDFNGDGKLDLAVANANDNTLSILLGNGDGTFQGHADYPTGTSPVSVAAGDFNRDGRLELAAADQNANMVSILLQVPAVTLSAPNLAFGNQTVSVTSAAKATTLTNSGSALLSISGINITGTNPGDFADTTTCGASLAAGASCTISVTFTPAASGARSATLGITDKAGGSPQPVNLSGTGVATSVNVSPTSITFPSQQVGTTSTSQTVTLQNVGGSALTVNSITITGTNSGDFAQSNTCGSSVAAGASCAITLTFTPAASGSRAASLTISDSDVTSPQTVALSGTGTGGTPAVSLSPTKIAFGPEALGIPSTPQGITLQNSGSGVLTITNVAIAGHNPADFAQTNTCGGSVAPGASCIVSVTFTPTGTGIRGGSVTFTDNASGSPQAVVLSGTGSAVYLNPVSLTFAAQTVGTTSSSQTVTMKNTGTSTLTVNSISITGTNSGDFAQTHTCGSSLAAGASCTISVTFTPTATGNRTGFISISDSDYTATQKVTLSGTGQ